MFSLVSMQHVAHPPVFYPHNSADFFFFLALFVNSLISEMKPTLFAESGGRGTGERHTVPQKAERMVLLEVALAVLEVAFS